MSLLSNMLARGRNIIKAAMGGGPISGGWGGGGMQDMWSTRRAPTAWEMLQQYKSTSYACANLNAHVFASQCLRLYASTSAGQAQVKRWAKKSVSATQLKALKKNSFRHVRKAVEVDEILEHPILTLLDQPNPFLDFFRMMELTDLYLEMTGKSYWYKERGVDGVVEQLWLVPTTEIYAVKDPYGYVLNYMAVRSQKAIPVEDIVFFSFPDLYAPYSNGKGPAQAGWGQITLQDKIESYNHATMENRGRPDVIITSKEGLGPDEAERLEAKYAKKFRRGSAGGALVLESAVEATPATFSNRDLEMYQMEDNGKLSTANAFGVPVSLLRTNDVNRANADAGHYQHARMSIRPRCLRFCGALNHQLAPDFDERLFFAFDDPVPIDVETELKERESNLKTGYHSINEEREEGGEKPVSWGDEPWIPIAQAQPSAMEEDAARAADAADTAAEALANPQTPETPEDKDSKDKTAAILTSYHCCDINAKQAALGLRGLGYSLKWISKALAVIKVGSPTFVNEKCGTLDTGWHDDLQTKAGHRRRLPSGAPLKGFLKGVFAAQKKEVLDGMSRKSFISDFKTKVVFHGVNFRKADWDKKIANGSKPIVSIFYEHGGKGLNARLGLDKDFNVAAPNVRKAVDDAVMKFAESTNETTSMELSDAIDELKRSLAEGLVSEENTVAELTKRVSAVFDRADKHRAETIAMSESSRAVHAGQAIAAKESGLEIVFKWLLSQDACPICLQIAADNEKGVPAGNNFAQIGDGPYADIPYPPAHPRCQCTVTEVVVGERGD